MKYNHLAHSAMGKTLSISDIVNFTSDTSKVLNEQQ